MKVIDIKKTVPLLKLHILLLFYSLGAVCSKMAGQAEFLSVKFCFFYFLVLLDLFIYAILWQQILKELSLITAYANKAITVIWGMLWGIIVFNERITIWNVVGAIIIMFGIFMVVKSNES